MSRANNPRRKLSHPSLDDLIATAANASVVVDDEDAAEQLREAESTPLPPEEPYRSYISRLCPFMPHLRSLLGDYNHLKSGRICVVDVSPLEGRGAPLFLYPSLERHDELLATLIDLCSKNEDDSPRTRLFIVEDLCVQLLEIVGHAFGSLHPEMFAEHLDGARHKPEFFQKIPSSAWNTSDLEKPFTSIKWHRPVYRQDGQAGLDVFKDVHEVVSTGTEEFHEEDDDDGEGIEEDDSNAVPSIVFLPRSMFLKRSVKRRARPHTTTNILRRSISLSSSLRPPSGTDIAFTWEEKATVLVNHQGRIRNVLFLLDPLPMLTYTRDPAGETERILPYKPLRKQRHPPWSLPHLSNALRLFGRLHQTNSTADDLCLYYDTDNGHNLWSEPILALLQIISRDVKDTFRLMSKTLEEITTDSTDDFRMQERLDLWRSLMNGMQKEVLRLTEEFRSFVNNTYRDLVTTEAQALVVDVEKESDMLLNSLRLCHSGLRADMGLLESRRGIAEAESVTRLTELAFIFIPLTFVSSLFSMQIKELQSGVPVSQFAKAAVIVIIVIYGIRLVVRARPVERGKRAIMSKARAVNGLEPNDPIPFTGFLRFLALWTTFGDGRVWALWLFLSAASISIIPVALLWSRSGLDNSFKAIWTIIFIPSGFIFAWLLASWFNTSKYKPWWSYTTVRRRLMTSVGRSMTRRKRQANAQV